MVAKRKHVHVTYSTLSSPDPLLHEYYEEDVVTAKAICGKTFPMYVNGDWVTSENTFASGTNPQVQHAAANEAADQHQTDCKRTVRVGPDCKQAWNKYLLPSRVFWCREGDQHKAKADLPHHLWPNHV